MFFSIIAYIAINFDKNFGNGRGLIWEISASMIINLNSWQKAVGTGQDCFYSYAYSFSLVSDRLNSIYNNNILTNAHSEIITKIIENGFLGAFCYAGIFISAVIELLIAAEKIENIKERIVIIYALPIISYFFYGLISFATVTSTPYAFICIGLGISEYKKYISVTLPEQE